MKPTLLVVELWGLGDLVIATPFLQAASERYAITLLAKPTAQALQPRFWPGVEVVPFVAPWTAFEGKYRLLSWPWREMFQLRSLAARRFDVGVSGRWDPRDHLLLRLLRVRRRLGFSRLCSRLFLTDAVDRPPPRAHRYENWRALGRALGLELPAREQLGKGPRRHCGEVLVHSGAAQPVRVWPLERYGRLVQRLRENHYRVQVACNPGQQAWWRQAGEQTLAAPATLAELMALIDRAGAFIGNDSGPAHLAALCGAPTFTIFGPQLPDWFAPLHLAGEVLEGKPCPYKPCSDYCRLPAPDCIIKITEEEVWLRVAPFVGRALAEQAPLENPTAAPAQKTEGPANAT